VAEKRRGILSALLAAPEVDNAVGNIHEDGCAIIFAVMSSKSLSAESFHGIFEATWDHLFVW